MYRIYPRKYKIICTILGVIIFYLTVRVKNYEHEAFVFLPKVHPNEVWEFVADFSNMKMLNPTIESFSILDESGNFDHWKYSVEYSEHLSHWPYLPNTAVAHFSVKSLPKKNIFLVDSLHKTCLLMGFLCLESQSEFRFSPSNSTEGALCEEIITYQCPAFLSYFCKREIIFQRTAIMKNLKKHFLSKNKM